ncbi:unnamed protein product [Closterium sp. NIES-54]
MPSRLPRLDHAVSLSRRSAVVGGLLVQHIQAGGHCHLPHALRLHLVLLLLWSLPKQARVVARGSPEAHVLGDIGGAPGAQVRHHQVVLRPVQLA